jgi:hypothetical protein
MIEALRGTGLTGAVAGPALHPLARTASSQLGPIIDFSLGPTASIHVDFDRESAIQKILHDESPA